ncbi:MerR family transcriptional regulator [Allorhizobium undicola]|uniref:MerR family transcriptional regulator n=1 Tax=Allorhizobium undicola TaxID=78527 RepID=UPI0004867B95|nr:MerR family transcriptional regulator [Allorhizobium undicola]
MNDIRYKIAEAARMAGVSPSTLRLWEGYGLIEPHRTSSGQRLYDGQHVERLKQISWMRTEKGLNPAAIRETLEKSALDSLSALPSARRQGGEKRRPAKDLRSQREKSAQSIGIKIRHLRREAGQTLDVVAGATGIAVSLLSTFERTSQGLSLPALHELARHFGTTIAALSGQEMRENSQSLIRSGHWPAWPATSSGVVVQVLSEGRNQMECHRFQLAPGASSEGAYQHEGEEFIHVLAGSMEIVLDGDQFFTLDAGDSFYFESRRPHSWRNTADGETVAIWINTPPTF